MFCKYIVLTENLLRHNAHKKTQAGKKSYKKKFTLPRENNNNNYSVQLLSLQVDVIASVSFVYTTK